ncbi:hypothetical protein LWC35_07405 [Pseudonocardia kujensis]|uniref:hypothetical protein n=1 Tax=Pseudonocardia kujensis TaxID=1128675 RepID=UPI001E37251D|nr:hypothetical protein [Pseudonocardia kujensis]MCE0762736.1 hypothetical protein [Pseudonocardia kujensis]
MFSGKADENLPASPFERIVVTDTIPLRPGGPGHRARGVLLADSIRRIFTDDSVSEVFDGQNRRTTPSDLRLHRR